MEQAHDNLDDNLDDGLENNSNANLNDQAVGDPPEQARDGAGTDTAPAEETGEPLARVRYGVAKELRLYLDNLVVEYLEEHEETRITLDNIKRLILTPGEYNPSKLVLMVDLDDGNTVIVAEGMTNVRAFRVLLAKLQEIRPQIELDPPDMDTQLQQALEIRRRSMLGCYGGVIGLCAAFWIIYLVVAYIGMHAGH
jgi:hypothetical protein